MNDFDIEELRHLLYFKMQLLQAEIRMNAMIAENKKREALGAYAKYSEKDFMDVIEKYGIYHNAFPMYGEWGR